MNIVSFFAPRREHQFYQDYTPFLDLLRASCKRFGHRHIVLTDDPGVGKDGDAFVVGLPENLMHAALAAQLAYLGSEFATEDTIMLGADCVLASDPARVFGMDFEIACTTAPFQDCILNTGAIFVRGGADAAKFWRMALDLCGTEWGDDQRALRIALNPTLNHGLYQRRGVAVRFLPVDPYNLAPEWPGDDRPGAVILHFRGPRKGWMVDYCHRHLGLGEGVKAIALPNIDDTQMLANVRRNSGRHIPVLGEVKAHDRPAVIVGGGPSLADTIDEVLYRWQRGEFVFALNGAAKYLAGYGIKADAQVIIDPRPENIRFVMPMHARHAYLASQCDPALFDALPYGNVTLFHCAVDGVAEAMGKPNIMIGGGLTSGLTAMALAFTLGYRALHLYGYDSSDRASDAHAYPQDETAAEQKRLDVWHDKVCYRASFAMFKQAEAFPAFAQMLADQDCLITVHGDGLLPAVARSMTTATPYSTAPTGAPVERKAS